MVNNFLIQFDDCSLINYNIGIMKKIAIIGGGASGTLLAILLKRKSNNFDVTIFDKKDFILKKIKASGNGRCNFANKNYLSIAYS